MIIRAKFSKMDQLKYISHLDLMRLFQRTFIRACIPIKYSEGFNPHPKLSFATALTLGVSSEGEYLDVELDTHISVEEFTESMNNSLPEGIRIIKAEYVEGNQSIMSLIRWSSYIIEMTLAENMVRESIEDDIRKLLAMDEILVSKVKKQGKQTITKQENIKDKIRDLFVLIYDENRLILKTTLMTGSVGNLKPELLIDAISKYTGIKANKEDVKIHRLELYIEENNQMVTPI